MPVTIPSDTALIDAIIVNDWTVLPPKDQSGQWEIYGETPFPIAAEHHLRIALTKAYAKIQES